MVGFGLKLATGGYGPRFLFEPWVAKLSMVRGQSRLKTTKGLHTSWLMSMASAGSRVDLRSVVPLICYFLGALFHRLSDTELPFKVGDALSLLIDTRFSGKS